MGATVMRRSFHLHNRAFLLVCLAVSACSGGDSLVVPPGTGTLRITTSTTGDEPDGDGYTFQLDAKPAEPIGSAGELTRAVTPGNHTILLAGIAPNCTVANANPNTITVVDRETTSFTFAVTCRATTGSLQVSAATSGSSLDPDGYTITLDGTDRGALGVSSAVTLAELVPGGHVVGLGSIPGNCLVQGDNLRDVTVIAGASATVGFEVICTAPPPNSGTLQITTVTTGPDPDPDGYRFTVDGGADQPIGANGVTSLTNFASGVHAVLLNAVAGNCSVQGTNPRSVTLAAGATAALSFQVSCTPASGGIRVNVVTSGASTDPDGYAVELDGITPGQRIATTGAVSFAAVSSGSHSVTLSDLAANCIVAGGLSRTLSVTVGVTSDISFSVTCTSSGGAALEKVSGDPQSGPAGSVLGAPLVVKVSDAFGKAVPGAVISWSITGGGSLSETSTQTGANGQASVTRTLGGTAGQQTTLATANGLVGSPVTFTHTATAATGAGMGRWDPAFTTPVVDVHMHLLPTGKVLMWGDRGEAQLWDPTNPGAGFTPVTKTFRMYCSGHTILRDGRLLVVGGTSPSTRGLRLATVFDPSSRSWSATTSMAQGRYYPTITALPDGEVLAVSGHDTTLSVVTIPEVWNGSGWRRLTTAPLSIPNPYYPAMFVAPNGKLFLAGFPQTSSYLDVTGSGQWTPVADRNVADRTMGSAVMYAPGKILYAGGGDPPTASAEVIDLNQAAPSWRSVPGMAFPRRQMNATLLADGGVLVTGGTSGPGFNSQAGAVHIAELWNPQTESWTTMASESKNRTYHGTALLLPSGQVLSSGSGEGGGISYANSEFSAQVFSPPYLFNSDGSPAARPSITSAPSTLSYGQSFTVQTPDAGSVIRGTLIRLSSVTHAFNMSQLIYGLTFGATSSTTVSAMAPPNANLAPPGPYMLFLINGSGAPSVAKMVMVGP
jgi:galactose oxidase-like protein/Big-like domain-containing protein